MSVQAAAPIFIYLHFMRQLVYLSCFVLFTVLSCSSQPLVKNIVARKPVAIDESRFVWNESPSKIEVLNDTVIACLFRYQVATYHLKKGTLLSLFDIRRWNGDSVVAVIYKTQKAPHDYITAKRDTSASSNTLNPLFRSMSSHNGTLYLTCYLPVAYRAADMSEFAGQAADKKKVEEAVAGNENANIIVFENKTVLLSCGTDLKPRETWLAYGYDEIRPGTDYIPDPGSGFFTDGKTLWAPVHQPAYNQMAQVFTGKEQLKLFAQFRLDGHAMLPEKALLGTANIPGYSHKLIEKFQAKRFQLVNDSLFVNDHFGLYLLPEGKPARAQLPDTTGEKKGIPFARYANTMAYISYRKNPADTTTRQMVLRITDRATGRLLLKTPLEKCRDIATYTNTFYTITGNEEHYYINCYEGQ